MNQVMRVLFTLSQHLMVGELGSGLEIEPSTKANLFFAERAMTTARFQSLKLVPEKGADTRMKLASLGCK